MVITAEHILHIFAHSSSRCTHGSVLTRGIVAIGTASCALVQAAYGDALSVLGCVSTENIHDQDSSRISIHTTQTHHTYTSHRHIYIHTTPQRHRYTPQLHTHTHHKDALTRHENTLTHHENTLTHTMETHSHTP